MNRTASRNYEVLTGKLGFGPLNAGPDVFSETSILQEIVSGKGKKFRLSFRFGGRTSVGA